MEMLCMSQDWPLCEAMSIQKERGKNETHTTALADIDDFAKKFDKEFCLVFFLSSRNSTGYEDNGAWIVDNGSFRHMTGMRSMFLSVWRYVQTCM